MRQSAVVGLIALVLAGIPRASDAGIGDLIWELSGPQMVGLGVTCRSDFKGTLRYCEWSPAVPAFFADSRNVDTHWFWSWGVAGYVSTGKNNRYEDDRACPPAEFPCQGKEIDYRAFDHRMLSFEPTIDYLVRNLGRAQIFVSAGPALHSVWNRDAEQFWKAGLKIVPIEIQTGRGVTVSLNLRYYPDGFGVDEFGKGVFGGGDRPSEWTWGAGASFPLFRKR